MTLARVSLASETVKRVRLFFLLIESISIKTEESIICQSGWLPILKTTRDTYLEIFVGGFLPFFGHRSRWRARESVSDQEKNSRDRETDSTVQEDYSPFSRRCFGTRTMWAKCDPPSCNPIR